MNAPLPTLQQLLGDGARAEGFEEWVAASFFSEEWNEDEGTKAQHRILRVLTIAMVEGARTETMIGSGYAETLARIGRGMALAFMAMATSGMRDDAGPKAQKELAKIARKFFREGVDYWLKLEAEARRRDGA
jgi:hypothetical protein